MSAALLIEIGWIYSYIGLGVAVVFLVFGIGRVCPSARGAYVFRPLIAPGVILLWPAVLLRWFHLERGSAEGLASFIPPRRIQVWAALVLAIAMPFLLLLGVLVRQDGPFERKAEQLSPPPASAASEGEDR